jgi:predicted ATPase/DNA-binding CsgD family transcriptional regulator
VVESPEALPRRSGLPVALNATVGRESEIERVLALLGRTDVRLVTLTGPGGIGKSRLAIEVARRAEGAFPDGAAFVALGSIEHVADVAPAVSRALGMADFGGGAVEDGIEAYLSTHAPLLVVDGFEHVLDAALLLARLLEVSPGLKILVASRAALRISGEREVAVPPLEVPTGPAGDVLDDPSRFAAVDLFVQRAQAVRSDFRLDASNIEAVIHVCSRLDGLPLAIELAAARVKVLEPAAMVDRVGPILPLLTVGPRDAPDRHRTLRDAISWSYVLLTKHEQCLFRYLTAFVDGWTVATASQLTTALGRHDAVLATLESLIDKNMVVRLPSGEGPARFDMLETIQEFGGEQLRAHGEEAEVRRAHAGLFAAAALDAASRFRSRHERAALDVLEREHGNLTAALRLLLELGERERALEMSVALARHWYVRGHVAEGRRWLDEAMSGPVADESLWVRASCEASQLATQSGDFGTARSLARLGLDSARERGDGHGIATALAALGYAAAVEGCQDEARAWNDESAALLRELGDPIRLVDVLCCSAVSAIQIGDFPRAREAGDEALGAARSLGDHEAISYALLAIAIALLFERPGPGTGLDVEPLLEEALDAAQAIGNRRWSSRPVATLGLAAVHRGDLGAAAARYEEAIEITAEYGDWHFLATGCLPGLGAVQSAMGRIEDGACLRGAADAVLRSIGALMPDGTFAPAEASDRAALGDAAYAAARRRGERMTIEEILATVQGMGAAPTPMVVPGEASLTRRELEVLRQIATGMTDAETADALFISRRTVHAHMRSIYRKIGVKTRAAATRYALEHALA